MSDLERAATSQPIDRAAVIPPWMASYFLFQCYVAEFGVAFDERKACYWIDKAEENNDECYNAQAWLLRMHIALKIPINLSPEEIRPLIRISIARGYRTCIEDAELILRMPAPVQEHMLWRQDIQSSPAVSGAVIENAPELLRETLEFSRRALHTVGGAVGMPYFLPDKLNKPWNLYNVAILDTQIEEDLGLMYSDSLIHGGTSTSGYGQGEWQPFDEIYVNSHAHTLLHLASAMGNIAALRHLLLKYKANIDNPPRSTEESPLVFSCRAGHMECSLFLLEKGANPSGHENGQESPLHWLCSFNEDDMPIIARRLHSAGALLEKFSGYRREILADWEELYAVSTSPLGRAVIMKSLPAVKVLLALGANPLARPPRGENVMAEKVWACTPVGLAAVLTLPDILHVLLMHLDAQPDRPPQVMDEIEMLQLAHSKSITPYDPTSLQSRLVRCGRDYRHSLYKTLEILQKRRQKLNVLYGESCSTTPEGAQLCEEVRLGNYDIVHALLELGHKANGSAEYRPIIEATLLNDERIFRLLLRFGADICISHSKDGYELSLLQVSAMRPKTSRPGLNIANYLIEAGLAIDHSKDGARSAFVLAVINGDFELADLLLKYGANVNFTYQPIGGSYWVTVLCELLQEHSEKNLKAIQYLFEAGRGDGVDPHTPTNTDITVETSPNLNTVSVPSRKPDLVSNKTTLASAIQILALRPPEVWNTRNQVSSRITQVVLSAFNKPEEINYEMPAFGTALCNACALGNLEIVTALLAYKADKSIYAKLAKVCDPIGLAAHARQFSEPVGSPLFMAKLRISELEQQDPQCVEIARLKSIIELLRDGNTEAGIGITENIRDLWVKESNTTDIDNGMGDSTLSAQRTATPQLTSIAADEASSHVDEPLRSPPAPSTLQDPEINQDHGQTRAAGDLQGVSTDHASVPDAKVASIEDGDLAP